MLALIYGEPSPYPKHNSESFPVKNELSEKEWHDLVIKVLKDLQTAADLTRDEALLNKDIGSGVSAREELVSLAAHNAYHFGRMVMLRQLLGIWSSKLGDTW
jgi:hypothetical protein